MPTLMDGVRLLRLARYPGRLRACPQPLPERIGVKSKRWIVVASTAGTTVMLGALGCGSSVSNESESTKSTVAASTTPATTAPPVETRTTTPAATAPQVETNTKQTSFQWGAEGDTFTEKDLQYFRSWLGEHGLPRGAYEVWAERHPKAANDVFHITRTSAKAWHKG